MFAAGGCTLIAFGRIGGSPYDTSKYSLSERSTQDADPFAVQCSDVEQQFFDVARFAALRADCVDACAAPSDGWGIRRNLQPLWTGL
jgi:hypothetical protein